MKSPAFLTVGAALSAATMLALVLATAPSSANAPEETPSRVVSNPAT